MYIGKGYYVYVLFRHDTGEPFYVGKGGRSRYITTVRYADAPSHKNRVILKAVEAGKEIPVVLVRRGLTNEQACEIEIALIAAIGREPNGPLTNKTSGGEGASDPSPESRAKKSISLRAAYDRIHSPEARAKRSAARMGHEVSDETRKKIAASLVGRKHDRDVVAKRAASNSIAQKGKPRRKHTQEEKAARCVSSKKAWENKENLRPAFTMKGRKHSEETKKKMSDAALNRPPLSDETKRKIGAAQAGKKRGPLSLETRNKISESQIGKTVSLETRAKQSASRQKYAQSPETFAKISVAMKRVWAERRLKRGE